jgi:signal transduction histidine kinase
LPKVAQLTERIVTSARHASEIVQRIRGMAARNAPERLPIDLNEVTKEALLFVRHDLEARAIKLAADLETCLPKLVGDRVLLQQVIVNLVLNSIQALAQKYDRGGVIQIHTGLEEGGALILAIRDNGPGIPAENLDRIFDGFFTTKAEGMGIGLSVCQSIIAAHGGRIGASNHPDGGAVLRFSLPLNPEKQ